MKLVTFHCAVQCCSCAGLEGRLPVSMTAIIDCFAARAFCWHLEYESSTWSIAPATALANVVAEEVA